MAPSGYRGSANRAKVKAMVVGTLRAKTTSIKVTSTSDDPRVWSCTKANSIMPEVMT